MYVCVWSFEVPDEHRADFERVYGPEGEWVGLFRRAAGYRSTRLLRLRDGRYVTIDEWESRSHYDAFRRALPDEYEALDRRCAHLALAEERVLTLDGEEVRGGRRRSRQPDDRDGEAGSPMSETASADGPTSPGGGAAGAWGGGSPSDAVRREITVDVPPERAFDLFAGRLSDWWPREYTWSGRVLERIGIEPREGGHLFEVGPDGFRCDWGRVLTWAPPSRLSFLWQIAPSRAPEPDPERASLVEVGFVPTHENRTRVELEHRDFARHGEGADVYRDAMASEHGWARILERYAAAVS